MIDPGGFSFRTGQLTPDEVGAVDAILISHEHPDHYDPRVLREFQNLGQCGIWTISGIGKQLLKEGIEYQDLQPGQTLRLAGFQLEVFEAQHGPLPIPIPDNVAFSIDQTVLHPGDSYTPQGIDSTKVLALPIAGPWARLVDAVDMIDRLQPEVVIPIHDWVVKDVMLQRMYGMLKSVCDQREIIFRPVEPGEVLDNP